LNFVKCPALLEVKWPQQQVVPRSSTIFV
jgi:hypothetical protein